MKVLSIRKVKEVQIQLEEKLDLDAWQTASDLQILLGGSEILEVKYLECIVDDAKYTYTYSIKYLEV